EACQVHERRRRLARGLARLARLAFAALDRRRDCTRARLVEETVVALVVAVRPEGGVEPHAAPACAVALELRGEAPERARHVGEHLRLALAEQGQPPRLPAARRPGGLLAPGLEPLRERAGGVHPDQPV